VLALESGLIAACAVVPIIFVAQNFNSSRTVTVALVRTEVR